MTIIILLTTIQLITTILKTLKKNKLEKYHVVRCHINCITYKCREMLDHIPSVAFFAQKTTAVEEHNNNNNKKN